MKKTIILPLLIIIIAFAACSKAGGGEVTTTPSEAYSATEYSFPYAVDAFAEITEASTVLESVMETSRDAAETLASEISTQIKTDPSKSEKTTAENKTTVKATQPATENPAPAETEASKSTTVKLTIKEGQALTEIFKLLDENGVADFDALMQTAQTYDYSYYPLVAAIPSGANRCFRLEGYLYPDTYEFYYGQKPQDVIGRFLRNGKAKITDSMLAKASALGYSMDEVITVASIVEKEGANSKEVAKIAAVIYNRLEAGMKLQMDSSIYYIERHVKPYLTGDVNRYNSYYNTYKCSALPAGPISNPGMRTINAALNPADVDYLYFCHDASANYYYAETYEEHQENLKLAGLN